MMSGMNDDESDKTFECHIDHVQLYTGSVVVLSLRLRRRHRDLQVSDGSVTSVLWGRRPLCRLWSVETQLLPRKWWSPSTSSLVYQYSFCSNNELWQRSSAVDWRWSSLSIRLFGIGLDPLSILLRKRETRILLYGSRCVAWGFLSNHRFDCRWWSFPFVIILCIDYCPISSTYVGANDGPVSLPIRLRCGWHHADGVSWTLSFRVTKNTAFYFFRLMHWRKGVKSGVTVAPSSGMSTPPQIQIPFGRRPFFGIVVPEPIRNLLNSSPAWRKQNYYVAGKFMLLTRCV